MFSISFDINIISGVLELDNSILKCHELVIPERLKSFKSYLKSLDGDFLVSSIIVCNKTFIIIDGHHRYHALKQLGLKKIPVTLIDYSSDQIKAYFDDRIKKTDILHASSSNKLLPPKSTKHVIFDKFTNDFKPIILISTLFQCKIS